MSFSQSPFGILAITAIVIFSVFVFTGLFLGVFFGVTNTPSSSSSSTSSSTSSSSTESFTYFTANFLATPDTNLNIPVTFGYTNADDSGKRTILMKSWTFSSSASGGLGVFDCGCYAFGAPKELRALGEPLISDPFRIVAKEGIQTQYSSICVIWIDRFGTIVLRTLAAPFNSSSGALGFVPQVLAFHVPEVKFSCICNPSLSNYTQIDFNLSFSNPKITTFSNPCSVIIDELTGEYGFYWKSAYVNVNATGLTSITSNEAVPVAIQKSQNWTSQTFYPGLTYYKTGIISNPLPVYNYGFSVSGSDFKVTISALGSAPNFETNTIICFSTPILDQFYNP